ncbi:ester cyclase [Nonomuraea sp. NPDC049480]|uniref:ester cyclase n=1 Tax=Nonomuraea sp. NPDC049480 TaxID=3364353 RepID=UPI0037B160E5
MAAQTDTDVVNENRRLMKQADDAFNSRDLDAMDALHHPEVVAYTTGAAEATRSVPPHRKVIEDVIRAFPDVHIHNDPYPIQFGQGEWLTVISKMTGTFTGELIGPGGKPIPPTGKSFEVKFTTIGRWQKGRLAEEWVFWDQPLLLQQIGLAG